jgi:hypothetical protein
VLEAYQSSDFKKHGEEALNRELTGFAGQVTRYEAIVRLNQQELDNARLGFDIVTAELARRAAVKNVGAA